MFKRECLEKTEEEIVIFSDKKAGIQKLLYSKAGEPVVVYEEVYGIESIKQAIKMQEDKIKDIKEKAEQRETKVKEKFEKMREGLEKAKI